MSYVVGIVYFCFGLWVFLLGNQSEDSENKVKILRVVLDKNDEDEEVMRIYKNFHNRVGIHTIIMGFVSFPLKSPLLIIIAGLFYFIFCNIKKVKTEEKIKKIQEEKFLENDSKTRK